MSDPGGRSPVVSAVVLAAGASTRMGRPKQLLPWGGVPMVRHVAETLAGSTASEVIVVVGCRADEVTLAVLGGSEGDSGRKAPIRVAVNSAWEDGMAASVACGVGAARADAEAFLITLSDHPAVGVDVIDVLIAEFAQRSPAERARAVLVPVHEGRRGHPTLLSAGLRAELEALGAARTLRDIVNANADPIRSLVEVSSDGIRMDLDTPSDYVEALLQMPRFASCIEEPEGSATDGN